MVEALPFIAMGTSLLSGAAAARGAQAQAAQSGRQRDIELRNVDLADRDVETHEQNVKLQVMRYREEVKRDIDTTRTRLAKSGVDPGMGTAMKIAEVTAARADDQIAQIQINGARAEQEIEEQAVGARQNAIIAGLNAKSYAASAPLRFGASLLTSATQFGTTAKKYGLYGF
jgi:hypothetical protein